MYEEEVIKRIGLCGGWTAVKCRTTAPDHHICDPTANWMAMKMNQPESSTGYMNSSEWEK